MGPSSIAALAACRCGIILLLVALVHQLSAASAFQPNPPTAIVACSRQSSQRSRSIQGCDNFATVRGDDDAHEDKSDPELGRAYSRLSRLYVGNGPGTLSEGANIQLSPDQSHYLTKVMRIFGKSKNNRRHNDDESLTQCVRLFDGINGEWLAKVSMIDDDEDVGAGGGHRKNRRRQRGVPSNLSAECLLQLRQQHQQHHSSEQDLPWLLFAPIKKHRAKILMEKCTELGAGRFVPILTERTDPAAVTGCIGAHQSTDALEKLAVQALEASEQCERLSVPIVTANVATGSVQVKDEEGASNLWDVATLLENWCGCENKQVKWENRRLLVCRERMPGNGILSQLRGDDTLECVSRSEHVAFMVGPEGGWSAEEEQLFEQYEAQHPDKIQSISLGDFVLRAETAAMTCIAGWNLSQEVSISSSSDSNA